LISIIHISKAALKLTKLSFFILTTFLLLAQGSVNAQGGYTLKQFFSEGGDLYSQPAKWNEADWLKVGFVAAGSFALMNFDEDIKDWSQTEQNYLGTFPIDYGRRWGEPSATLLMSGLLFLHGVLADNQRNQNTAFEILQSTFYATSVTQIGKMLFGRARPYMNKGAWDFNPVYFAPDDFWSYPSGHTTSAFALSTTLAQSVKADWLKVLCYLPAFTTAFARIYENKHWASDVFAGAAIGYFVAKYLTELHKKNELMPHEEPPAPLINISFPL